ncbi:type IV-A pilus assembly ATPase PilB, partial [Moraxella catarrhalis]|nr:type IV-A pilus assembly ATPase PilB [Moraxella catarrhalis]
MTAVLPSLAPLILQHQLMTEDALSKAATDAKNLQRSFVQHLVASGLIDAAKLLHIQSLSYNLPIYEPPSQLSQVVETGLD